MNKPNRLMQAILLLKTINHSARNAAMHELGFSDEDLDDIKIELAIETMASDLVKTLCKDFNCTPDELLDKVRVCKTRYESLENLIKKHNTTFFGSVN